jgi:cytochrome c peroxidase
VVDAGTIEDTKAYIRAMPAVRSPYLAGGKLSPAAAKGKTVFERSDTGCATCHSGALRTDLKLYDVGTRGELDRRSAFDTPTLMELWRTAPYLHDGSAVTLKDVLTTRNKGNRHGKTSHLSKGDLDALVEYLRSL